MPWKSGIKRAVLSVSIILLLLPGTGGCSGNNGGKDEKNAAGSQHPAETDPRVKSNVVLKRLDGTTAHISDYSDKLLFVTVFATWHLDSREMIPIMNRLQSKFSRKVTFLGISLDSKNPAVVRNFVVGNSINFEVMFDGQSAANALGGARKLPTTYILLRDGTVFTRIEGLQREKKYEDALRYVFNKRL
ncbi:MAG: TlpA family protein disulfide reductase [Candidatus Krumholzibacteriota bacterium]|nr:TlpA family protein disulfide reductase [Candidatus Krumholzibacteriota bacterium]